MDESVTSISSQSQEKKNTSSSLEELSKEELITKCNKLLVIARKAKSSKDELAEENKRIKEEIKKLEEQNAASQVLQELVESLTQNKLASATQISELSKQISDKDVSIKQLQSKFDELIIENEALKRQTQRLTDENDSLLVDMQSIDFKNEVDDLSLKIKTLNEELSELKLKYDDKCSENLELKASIESNNAPSDEIKIRYDKTLKKMKAYREKLFEIYEQAKIIKNEKGTLLKMTKEYGEYVNKWQKDIANASTRLVIQIKELNLEIKSKDEEIKRLEESLEKASKNSMTNESVEKYEEEIKLLKEAILTKDKMLDEEREAQKKLKQAVKKPSVLDLELVDLEKTLEELNRKLEVKKKQVLELESTINVQNETINSFKSQISSLEENLESEKAHSIEIKKNLDCQLNLLRTTEHERTESNLQLDLLNKNYESLKLENAETKMEMAKTIGEMEKRHQTLEIERNDLLKNISFLENEVEKYKKLSLNHEKETETIRTEFASYKIRAQSVLRQNQKTDFSREQELQDEVISLQKSLENIKEANQKYTSELETLKKTYNDLVENNSNLQTRYKNLLTTFEKQSDEVLEESRKRNLEYDESIKRYQLQIDTLNVFYKKHIQDLEESKKNAVQELQEKISNYEKMSISNTNAEVQNSEPSSLPKTDDQKICTMLDLMDREVEGSEDQSSQSTTFTNFHIRRKISRGRELMPLDELLNSSFDDNSNEVNDETMSNYSSPSELLEHVRAKLQKEENRVQHLTTLLADSEKDLARMQQLNEMLKEEVRRTQRSIEREEHVKNSEYLKNVVMKFVTLNNGDEKQRLIPVLNTILKLSSDEIQTLQNACKGGWSSLWN
ncbi:hypothetical protein PVAND_010991 [Polypedilum vanderplanki]|uniref:GRIP domain-containing protein n=1 Tax=Polypedilum vanderplanki TaxID=319348 RepID=A0A9J6CHR4_POLVA|nr:hypothetical protein PVAND_010991 [Polypedilum vanderplanki]